MVCPSVLWYVHAVAASASHDVRPLQCLDAMSPGIHERRRHSATAPCQVSTSAPPAVGGALWVLLRAAPRGAFPLPCRASAKANGFIWLGPPGIHHRRLIIIQASQTRALSMRLARPGPCIRALGTLSALVGVLYVYAALEVDGKMPVYERFPCTCIYALCARAFQMPEIRRGPKPILVRDYQYSSGYSGPALAAHLWQGDLLLG